MMEKVNALQQMLRNFRVIDLSHTIENGMPKWPTHPQIVVYPACTHEHDGYFNQCLVMGEHTGSHVDAPAHTVPYRSECTIDTFGPDVICAPAVVYDCRAFELQAGDRLTAAQLLQLEQQTGLAVAADEIAIINFGWDKHWSAGPDWQYYSKNEPGLSEDAVELLAERKVRAVGFDNISSDMPIKDGVEFSSTGHYKHWLPNNILLIEELTNLDLLPSRCFFVAIPLKIKGGSGSPIRPFALVPREEH